MRDLNVIRLNEYLNPLYNRLHKGKDRKGYNNALGSSKFKLSYLDHDYWQNNNKGVECLYWAGIDLEKFYPNIKIEYTRKKIVDFYQLDKNLTKLILMKI